MQVFFTYDDKYDKYLRLS